MTIKPTREQERMDERLAEIAARQAQRKAEKKDSDTFLVKALRKRGTDMWYAITYTALDDGSYPFVTRRLPDLWHPDFLKEGIGFVAEANLPEDAELVTLQFKIIEP